MATETARNVAVHGAADILCKDRADSGAFGTVVAGATIGGESPDFATIGGGRVMRLLIEIAAAALLMVCITATSAAYAAGKTGRSADGLSCSFSVAQNATPAARCAAIKRQCGGKFYANACGDKLLSAAN
jgi:hypothetical protein